MMESANYLISRLTSAVRMLTWARAELALEDNESRINFLLREITRLEKLEKRLSKRIGREMGKGSDENNN
jgi:hypothetical protein